jgi:hypothetical protein
LNRILLSLLLFFSFPAYNASPPIALSSGDVGIAWNAETPTPGNGLASASQQFTIFNTNNVGGTPFSVDGKFSGAPGTFEVDVQVASTDSDTNYQTCSNCNITTVDSVNNTFHLDAVQVNTRFIRLLMRSRANSVSITANFTGG